jgi:uncharacterized protein YjbI with pentapeptide repeats
MEVEELKKENKKLKESLQKIENKRVAKINKKKRTFSFIGSLIAGKSLKDSIYDSINEFNQQRKVSLDTTSNLAASLIKRLTRIGVIALLIALLPTSLMIYQNNLLKKQNKKIQDQTYLSEASRRSAQMFIMGDVLSDINTERTQGSKTLSGTLTGRIVSLSRAMKPYRYLLKDELIPETISPERGQLLITLCKSDLNTSYFVDEILQESDFTKSELMNANLKNATLREINLNGSNLENSYLVNVDLRRASLKTTNLNNADLEDADLRNANLQNAILKGAYLYDTKLYGANLTNVTLDSAKVNRVDWLLYIKDKLKLKGAKELYENYKIDSVYITSNNKQLMILKR